MTLYAATRHLHHACERHPLGQRMTAGHITAQEWADWLAAFSVLHERVDDTLPPHMKRRYALRQDFDFLLQEHGVAPRIPTPAANWAKLLVSDTDKLGAAYVLHGAHRNGGPVLRKVLAPLGLPSAHTHYDLPAAAKATIDGLAARLDLVEAACGTFGALLRCMDEIVNLPPSS